MFSQSWAIIPATMLEGGLATHESTDYEADCSHDELRSPFVLERWLSVVKCGMVIVCGVWD